MADKRAYVRKMREIIKRYTNLEGQALAEAVDLMVDVRDQMAGILSISTDFSAYHLDKIMGNLTGYIAHYRSALEGKVRALTGQINILGGLYAVEPFNALNVGTVALITDPMVHILVDFTADLIKAITDDLHNAILTQLRLAALGGISPFRAMQNITQVMGLPPFGGTGVAYRAERILRTELHRIFNMSSHAQQMANAQMFPGLMKTWIATADERTRLTHLIAHSVYREAPIPVEQPFIVGGVQLMYPGDPAGPPHETINCRCTEATIHPEVGVIPSGLDTEIDYWIQEKEAVYG